MMPPGIRDEPLESLPAGIPCFQLDAPSLPMRSDSEGGRVL